MILGIGIDIAENKRFKNFIENKKLLLRFFSSREIEIIKSKISPLTVSTNYHYQSVAGKFCAKEAFIKAINEIYQESHNLALNQIEVLNKENKTPYINITNNSLSNFLEQNSIKIHVSISHEQNFSIAQVIISQ